jgi:hypothetical protein
MRLLHFIADLTRNTDLQLEFSRDARVVMDQRELTPAEQELVMQRDAGAIGAAIARELRAFTTEQRFRWPNSSFEIKSVEPKGAVAGGDVRVVVEGQYFPRIKSCTLLCEDWEIEGAAEGLVTGPASRFEITFSIPRDAPSGDWNVRVTDVEGHGESAELLFKIASPTD